MIIVGGFNVYPVEIENVLLRHPDIAAAAVIGMPDHRLGEVGMAFVVLRSGARATEARIISWSRTQMANYKVPRAVQIVDDLPLNATGKVQKDVLRARVATRRAGPPADAAEPSGRCHGRPAQSRE
jgi:acyl-CoA synthetase (AMP-forming)/AMP-acid ligase II